MPLIDNSSKLTDCMPARSDDQLRLVVAVSGRTMQRWQPNSPVRRLPKQEERSCEHSICVGMGEIAYGFVKAAQSDAAVLEVQIPRFIR